jgi:prepilin-type processing-associated H-X9-DG protein
MPSPPRYGAKNTIGFVDGSTQDLIEALDPADLFSFSQSRLKADTTALSLYANDYDETLPLQGQWMDEVTPYLKQQSDFQSPAVELVNPNAYGYAMETTIAGRVLTAFASPDTQVALFDSTDLSRNATDPTTTLPNPPRYGSNNTIVFLDGHVQGTPYTRMRK